MHIEPPPEPPGFTVTITGETVTVVLSGELDVTSEDFLTNRLARVRQARPRRLIFEAAQVTYIDCASARLIAGTGDWLPAWRQAGHRLPRARRPPGLPGQRARRTL